MEPCPLPTRANPKLVGLSSCLKTFFVDQVAPSHCLIDMRRETLFLLLIHGHVIYACGPTSCGNHIVFMHILISNPHLLNLTRFL